jgi:hypothetical protein
MEQMKITKEEFEALFSDSITKKQYDGIIRKINDRFDEICKKFFRHKGTDYWFDYDTVSYDDRDAEGYFDPESYKEYIGVIGENINPPPGYDRVFPTRWLWEDFEEEMKQVIEDSEKQLKTKKEEKKRQAELRKQRIKVLKASIKTKLTPEELKIVKFK